MPSDLLILIESRVFLWWILVSMFRCAGALCFVYVLQINRRTLAAGGARHTSTRQQRAAPVGAAGQVAPRPAAGQQHLQRQGSVWRAGGLCSAP